jgi:hypothetical protein
VEKEFDLPADAIRHRRVEHYVRTRKVTTKPARRGRQLQEHEELIFQTARNYIQTQCLDGESMCSTDVLDLMEMAYEFMGYSCKNRSHLLDKFMNYAPDVCGWLDPKDAKERRRAVWTTAEKLQKWHEAYV